MATLKWPTSLPTPNEFSAGPAIVSDVKAQSLGAMSDVLHRYTLRSCTVGWNTLTNADFAQVDALVDLLGQRRSTVAVPWMAYQVMAGGGTGTPRVDGNHSAGDTTLDTKDWAGSDPRVDYGDLIQLGENQPRLYRVLGPANGATNTISIEPGLWEDADDDDVIYHLRNTHSATSLDYLGVTMELANPGQVQGQVFPTGDPSFGRGLVLSFVEAVRAVY